MNRLCPSWPIISQEEFFKLLFTFIIIVFAGSWINNQFQDRTWDRQVRYELLKNELDDERSTINDLTKLINKRLFATNQIIWAYQNGNSSLIDSQWEQYMTTVNEWNTEDTVIQSKLVQTYGYSIAGEFLNETDDLNNDIPTSIHYKFFKIHQELLIIRNCKQQGCSTSKAFAVISKLTEAVTDQQSRYLGNLNKNLINQFEGLKTSPLNYINSK